ncbi:glycoside hydrolase family 3 protein [Allonocardiopsis opalescens]|uniref:Beta-N-acetylhexosaminidase n=1 Tax=Allonocardiopsis opalescens TaxID=1144618 RepID=A0A2T0QFD7_9ACTN|nr:glycoside hydrolase family 3 N-terminal domain-containing protein [Allonocardiopsis opalescens]PRY02639.1 beta-N-acetylhexosaminidase [Allonocardiopsis opalescens]
MPADRALESLANSTLLVPFRGTTAPRWVLDAAENGLGGVCLFAFNITGPEQLRALSDQLRAAGGDPLVSLDEEGGDVTRVWHSDGCPYPGNAALGAVDDVDLTERVHLSLGAELAAVGINLDLAPSVDVNTADDNPVIGTRAFGADPDLVSRHAAAAVTGLQAAGIAAAAKHFPGHGSTRQDSHHVLPLVDADLDLLESRELAPFRAAIGAGVHCVLTGHLLVPGLTGGGPATFSPAVVGELLRGRLGFDGLVITDALEMRAASADIGLPEASVRALLAGCDLLCLGASQYEDVVAAIRAAIVAAVREGRLPVERLEDAAERVRRVRSWAAEPAAAPPDPSVGAEAARRAITVSGALPALDRPLVVECDAPPGMAVGAVPWGLAEGFGPDVVRVGADGAPAGPEGADAVLAQAGPRSLVVVVRDAHRYPRTRALVERLTAARPDTVVVEMGLPVWRPECAAYIAAYSASRASGRAVTELLQGTWTGASTA